MVDWLGNFFSSGGFIPHGHCYLWQPELVWLHVVSDSLIALAYYSIPVTLLYFVNKRQDLPFDWVFLMFGAFIIACGTTHIMEVWTLWHPTYWLSGAIKVITASISLYTAALLVPVVPKALALPSPEQLEAANRNLENEIAERQQAEQHLQQIRDQLEVRVQERTAELARVNEDLRTEIIERERALRDRQQADLALRESRERYRAFIEQSSEAIWRFELEIPMPVHLTEEEQIQHAYQYCYLAECNQVMAQMYGVASVHDMIGARLGDLLVRSDPRNTEYLRAFISSGYRLVDAESYEVDRQGNLKCFLNNLVGTVEDGVLIRAWGNQRDITDRKQAEEALHRANVELERRVQERTEQLLIANEGLRAEICERERALRDRQQAEAALRQSEARYRAIVEDQTELIIRYLPDSTMLFANQAFCRYFGLNQDEMIGKSYVPRIYEEDRAKVTQLIQSMSFENPTTTVENRVIVGEEIRWTQWNNRMIFDSQGRFIECQGVGRDITDRKQREAMLQSIVEGVAAATGKDFFCCLVQELANAMQVRFAFIAELVAGDRGRARLLAMWTGDDYSETFEYEIQGTPCEHVVGRDVAIFPFNIQECFPDDLWLKEAGVESYLAIPLFSTTGAALGHLGVMHNQPLRPEIVSEPILRIFAARAGGELERKQAEEQLQATNAQMLALFAAMDDLVVVRNAQGRCMDILTPRASHLLYKPADQMLGKTLYETFPQNIANSLFSYIQQALATQQPVKAEYCLNLCGRETWLSANISSIDPNSVIWVIRDISEQHAALHERMQAEAQIKLSLREKEVLLKEIHHRVKNNLQIVDSLLQMQSRRTGDRYAKEILIDSRNRIASIALVHEKLYRSEDLANIAFTQYVPDLTAHLFDSYNISSTAVTLNTEISDISLEIETAIPCGLIINELVSNSLKYAFPANQQGEILVKFYTDSNYTLTLIVQDNGIGIPEKFNIDETKSLGLTLVQNLVEQLEGTLEMNRQQGTEFKISFPKNRTGL